MLNDDRFCRKCNTKFFLVLQISEKWYYIFPQCRKKVKKFKVQKNEVPYIKNGFRPEKKKQ